MMQHNGEEIYADTVAVKQSKHASSLILGNHLSGVFMAVHMNPVVAKHTALILRMVLKEYERVNGDIPISEDEYKTMGVAPEDW